MSSRYSTVVCHMMEPKRLYISLGYIGRRMKCILCYSVTGVWDSHGCWQPLCCSFLLCLWPLPSAEAPAVGGSWKGLPFDWPSPFLFLWNFHPVSQFSLLCGSASVCWCRKGEGTTLTTIPIYSSKIQCLLNVSFSTPCVVFFLLRF